MARPPSTFPVPKQDYLTSIQILGSTREALKAASRKNQTYDDKLRELLNLQPIRNPILATAAAVEQEIEQ